MNWPAMLHKRSLLALSVSAVLSACVSGQTGGPDAKTVESEPAKVADPMASFARRIGGEWRVTFASGENGFQAWRWGPEKHSIRKMDDALEEDVSLWGGEVYYWHPGRKQVRTLSVHGDIPGVGRGVGEGSITFKGETAEGVLDLHQPCGRRKLGVRWSFDRIDKYHDTLLEDNGAGLKPLAGWDYVRIKARGEARPHLSEETPKLSKSLKVFEGDRVVPYVVRFDFEKDGSLRHRVWSLKDTERTQVLDVPHKRLHRKKE